VSEDGCDCWAHAGIPIADASTSVAIWLGNKLRTMACFIMDENPFFEASPHLVLRAKRSCLLALTYCKADAKLEGIYVYSLSYL
jgi:hypothetical protein